MDFSWSQEAVDLHRAAAEFGAGVLNAGLDERDRRGEFSRESWRRCAEFGVLGLPIPEALGGSGLELPTVAYALEGLGYGCCDNGLLFSLGAQLWSVQMPILLFGSEEQKARYLPRLVAGETIGGHAVSEAEAGSDVFSLRTTAVEDADGYILDGAKSWVTSGPHADVFLVLATLDPTQGAKALTAFLVDRDTPGVGLAQTYEKMGLRTSTIGELVLSNCLVPATAMLGKAGAGSTIFGVAMEWERTFILVPALGTMRRQLEQCVAHARTRRQFGAPIGRKDAVSSKLAEMHLRLETSRLLAYRAAWAKQQGKRMTREPSEVKLHLSESWVQTSLDALQINGASGYMSELGIERDLRDALASKIYSGTSEIQRMIIASFLGV
jgi:alkylation response protein AidB-like acyl-CoA dehydrogenase